MRPVDSQGFDSKVLKRLEQRFVFGNENCSNLVSVPTYALYFSDDAVLNNYNMGTVNRLLDILKVSAVATQTMEAIKISSFDLKKIEDEAQTTDNTQKNEGSFILTIPIPDGWDGRKSFIRHLEQDAMSGLFSEMLSKDETAKVGLVYFKNSNSIKIKLVYESFEEQNFGDHNFEIFLWRSIL
jgi:hypothetical protein